MRIVHFLQSPAGTVLRYACSVILLGALASQVDWQSLGALAALSWPAVAAAVLLAGLAYPLQAWRWQILLRSTGVALPGRWVHAVTWIGQFYSAFLPGGVAGDAVRLGYLWRAVPGRGAAGAAALIADRLIGFAALFALGTLALAVHLGGHDGPAELHRLLAASSAATLLLLLGAWSVAATRWWDPLTARLLGSERAAALHAAARALGDRPGALTAATLLSVAVWLADFAALWLLARSLGLPAGPLTMTVAASAAYVASMLPVSIGGHGVREGTLVLTLGWLGFGIALHPAVLLLAAGFWGLTVFWSLAGGLFPLVPAWTRLAPRPAA